MIDLLGQELSKSVPEADSPFLTSYILLFREQGSDMGLVKGIKIGLDRQMVSLGICICYSMQTKS